MAKINVKQHCSILNYLKNVNSDLYDLIQNLCLGRSFSPRRGTRGVTFLNPSKKLTSDLLKLAEKDALKAVETIKSLIIVDYLPSCDDLMSVKDDVPTALDKKLVPDKKVGNKVVFKNGSEVSVDSKFVPREDRMNMVVYDLDKKLVDTEGNKAEFKYNKANSSGPKVVKGGGEFSLDRKVLFNTIMKACANDSNGKDSAMECLVTIIKAAEDEVVKQAICSQLSWDTKASLAIVLQPYRTANDNCCYVSDELLKKLHDKYSINDGSDLSSYWSYVDNPVGKYREYMECGFNIIEGKAEAIRNLVNAAREKSNKAEIIKIINQLHNDFKTTGTNNAIRNQVLESELFLAEAELRILSAHINSNSNGRCCVQELNEMFKKHNLNKPLLFNDETLATKCEITHYISLYNMMLCSDAIFYIPNLFNGARICEWVSDPNKAIKLDTEVCNEAKIRTTEGYYTNLGVKFEKLFEAYIKSKNQ